MRRIKLDTAVQAVKEFGRGLPVGVDGVELELDGRVLCKIILSSQLAEAGKEALLKKGRELVQRACDRAG